MANQRMKNRKPAPRISVNPVSLLLNSVIGALLVVILLFAYSLYDSRLRDSISREEYGGTSLEEIPTANLLSQETLKAEVDLVAQVLNGSGKPGIAATYQKVLNGMGVDVINVGNAPNNHFEESVIYFHGNRLEKAEKFAMMIGLGPERITEKDPTALGNDVTLVLGKDFMMLKNMSFPKEDVKLQILNGCGVDGISSSFRKYLQTKGYDVLDVRNAAHFKFENTVLRYDDDSMAADAQAIRNLLGLGAEQVRKVEDLGKVNISLIIGRDYDGLNVAQELRKR